MSAANDQIRKALAALIGARAANSAVIWSGYDNGTGRTGWHYVPFGKTAVFLGASLSDALAFIGQRVGA